MVARALLSGAVLLFLLQGACARPSLKTTSAAVDPDYSPQKVFFSDFASAWESTLQGLKGKKIPVSAQDREKGIIRTDYQPGPATYHLGKWVPSRYQYNIFFFKEGEKKTILNLRCVYEIQPMGGKSYTDASGIYPDEVVGLEKELYRTIESFLLPRETARESPPKLEEGKPIIAAQPPKETPPPAKALPETPQPKEAPPAPSASPPQVPVELAPLRPAETSSPRSASIKDAQPISQSPAKEATPFLPRIESKAKVSGYGPKIFFVTQKNTSLREEPSLQSKIILNLKKGMKLEKIGESGEWVKVKIWEQTVGWVHKDLLQEAP